MEVNELAANILIDPVQSAAPKLFQTVNFQKINVDAEMNVFQMVFEEAIHGLCREIERATGWKPLKPTLTICETLIATIKKNPPFTLTAPKEVETALIRIVEN